MVADLIIVTVFLSPMLFKNGREEWGGSDEEKQK